MPQTSMSLGARYGLAMVFLATSLLSAAASDIETSSRVAKTWVDTFGILPMMALAAFLAMGWALYQSYRFTTDTLVNLVERSIRSEDRLTQAIRMAPCGESLTDSDNPEQTPHTRAMEVVQRRRERIKRTEDEQG